MHTVNRLEALCGWYQGSLHWDYPPDPGPWRRAECDRFDAAAPALFQAITAALADDYGVINSQRPVSEDADLAAYLKDPKGFRR